MKVLWIVNSIFPNIAQKIGRKGSDSGGWMVGLSEELIKEKEIELTICTIYDGEYQEILIENINYILVPKNQQKFYFKKIHSTIYPNVVHIHGTEFDYGLNYIKVNGNKNVIISIQGLVSIIGKYYASGITFTELLRYNSLKDIIKFNPLFNQYKSFHKRGLIEKEYFKLCNNFIGRTEWDKAHTFNLNPKANYFHCDEILRNAFYQGEKWSFENCEKNTIFLSQATYPIKGFHQIIKAVGILKQKNIRNIKIKVAGKNIYKYNTAKERILQSSYAFYINSLIRKYNLEDNIEFLGSLSEIEMRNQYLKCNLFICPSSIENSPNSLAEAQILGVPSIASYVGGTNNMINHQINGILYRYEEVEMLAYYLQTLMDDEQRLSLFSSHAIETSLKRHNKTNILLKLQEVYKLFNI